MGWGHSAGGAAIDFLNYAYWDDPIVNGIFMQSGITRSGFDRTTSEDNSQFTYVAKGVGCDFPDDEEAELECMRKVDYHDLLNYVGRHGDSGTAPVLNFFPVTDETLVFANKTKRFEQGFVARVPAIFSTTSNEGAAVAPLDIATGQPPDRSKVEAVTNRLVCDAGDSTILRNKYGLPPTYRYQYVGNWTNQSPKPWIGASHGSDLAMIHSSYREGKLACCDAQEAEASRIMGQYVLAFMRDPHEGPKRLGWLPADTTRPDGGLILRFGLKSKLAQNTTTNEVQKGCSGNGTAQYIFD